MLIGHTASHNLQNIDDKRLVVKVSYRSGVGLTPLSPLVHSGGERVVATMLYMLALQVRGKALEIERVRSCGPSLRLAYRTPCVALHLPGNYSTTLSYRRRNQPGHGL